MSARIQSIAFYLALAFLLLALASCRTAPIHNVHEAAVATGKTDASLEDIQKAIVRAGASLGWNMSPVRPGLMTGTLHLRKHTAVVEVRYDRKTYSILYKDSQNLDYNGSTIHSNYNGWIQNLNRAIQTQLTTL